MCEHLVIPADCTSKKLASISWRLKHSALAHAASRQSPQGRFALVIGARADRIAGCPVRERPVRK
jgi:hypothetical protein